MGWAGSRAAIGAQSVAAQAAKRGSGHRLGRPRGSLGSATAVV